MYAGYGLLADRRFVQELFGRSLRPWEREDVAYGFKLKVLQRDELPQKVQDETHEGFKIYGAVPDLEGRGKLKVLKLDLSETEKEAVRALNFGDELYTEIEAPNDQSISGLEDGGWPGGVHVRVIFDIDVLKEDSKGTLVDGMTYLPCLNGEDAAMATAREIRARFIQTTSEGQPSRKESQF